MAEALGIVAAAVQLGQVAVELKQICSSVKHAPEKLQQLLEELETLEEVLQTIAEQEATISNYASTAVAQRCRQRCDKALKGVKPVCNELFNGIKRCRIRGSIKFMFKDGFLEKARQDIEKAKSNLILAQLALSNVLISLNVQQQLSTQSLIVSSSASITSMLEDACQIPQKPGMTISEPAVPNVRRIYNGGMSKANTRRLLLQSLWIGKRIEVIHQQAHSGWNLLFRTYNIRSESSPPFNFVCLGDVASLRQLFDTGQASSCDRDKNGQNMLHYATAWGYVPMIKFLRQRGLDPDERDDLNISCLHMSLYTPSMTLEGFASLTENSLLEELFDNPARLVKLAAYHEPRLLSGLIPIITPDWSTFDFDTRLGAALTLLGSQRNVQAKHFWLCLSQRHLDAACVAWEFSENPPFDSYGSLVYLLAGQMSRFWYTGPYDLIMEDYLGWRAVLRAAVRAGGLRATFDHEMRSPMLAYLFGCGFLYDHFITCQSCADLGSARLTHRLRVWAQEMFDIGQDLEEYGRWEAQCLSDSNFEEGWGSIEHGLHLFKFIYGKNPEDWQIWVSTSADEYAGEFWESLETDDEEVVSNLPGSWPEPESSEEYWITIYRDKFRRSQRRRRRWLRYLNLTVADQDEDFDKVSSCWREDIARYAEEGKQRKTRRADLFKGAGIPLPY